MRIQNNGYGGKEKEGFLVPLGGALHKILDTVAKIIEDFYPIWCEFGGSKRPMFGKLPP